MYRYRDSIGEIAGMVLFTVLTGAMLAASVYVIAQGEMPNPRLFIAGLIGFPLFLLASIRMIVRRIKSIPAARAANRAYPGKLKAAPAQADALLARGENLAAIRQALYKQGIDYGDADVLLGTEWQPGQRCPTCKQTVKEFTNLARQTGHHWWTCSHCGWVRPAGQLPTQTAVSLPDPQPELSA